MISTSARALVLFLCSAFLCLALPLRAQDSDSADEAEERPVHPGPRFRAIPYPNGALYVQRGISGAFMGGKHKNSGEDQSLFQWQGELGYFYKPWLSGGLGFKITAGEPSDNAQKIFNRYFINARAHKAWENLALYIGPQIGMGNLNVLTDSTRRDTVTTSINIPKLKEPIQNTKPTLSLDFGGGWKFCRYVGFTMGSNMEYSFVTEEGVGWSNALNLHFNPGLALDILAFTDSLRRQVSGFYVSVELQSGFLIFEKGDYRQDQAGIFGIGVAF